MSIAVGGALLALLAPAHAQPPHHARPGCPKLFTVQMGERAARRIYAGTRDVSKRNYRLLGRIEMCQRNPQAQWFVRWYDRHQRALWRERRQPKYGPEIASWYDDSGATASGLHYTYGFASLKFGSDWGRSVTFCVAGGGGRCAGPSVVGQLDDHGPYVAGRGFDLNPTLKAALGCSDLCSVYWH